FLRVLWRIVLPMNLVPLLIVLTFTFIGVVGSFTIPFLIGANAPQMMGVAIQAYFSNYNQPQPAVAMAVLLFAICALAGAVYVCATSRSGKHAVTVCGPLPRSKDAVHQFAGRERVPQDRSVRGHRHAVLPPESDGHVLGRGPDPAGGHARGDGLDPRRGLRQRRPRARRRRA